MRLLKNKKTIFIALIIAAFAAVGGGIWLQSNQPSREAEPGRPQTSLPGAISPSGPTAYEGAKHATQQSVVRFSDEANKQDFLKANNLSSDDLKKVDELPNTYIVNRPEGQLTPSGALVSEQKQYMALLAPNDPIYPQWYTDKISAPAAWDTSTGSSSTVVADIDTGFALNHEDLADRWAINPSESGPTVQQGPAPNCTSRGLALDKNCNNLDEDGDGNVDNWRGWDFAHNDNDPLAGTTSPSSSGATHGTETAGLIGASGNNAKGVASINWGAKILPIEALDDNGIGSTTAVASAIHYAVDQGAKVINMSLGTASQDPILKAELDYAQAHDVVVLAAAGNCGSPTSYNLNGCSVVGQMIYPANYPQVLAVGATDINDNRASFSSWGSNLDVVAPGSGSLRTTVWSADNQTSLYSTDINGTSFSSPIVAGLAALYRGLKPAASANETVNAITSNTDKVSGMAGQNFTNDYGFGRVNTAHALNGTPPVAPAPAPLPNSTATTLSAGGILHKDDYLLSPDGRSALALQRNGNFVLYDNFKLVWETGALGRAADRAIMQPDGNFVVYDSSNQALWNSTTDGNAGARLIMQTDGNVVIYSSSNVVLWATHTLHNPDNLNYIMSPGFGGIATMYPGQSIYTPDRRFRLILQTDGNLVLYSPTKALWASGTDGQPTAFLTLQSDGNLVLYDRSVHPLWASYTVRFGLTRLIVQGDGNLVLYDQFNVARWNTETAGAS
jgi:subtilisin family serine protease